MITQLKKLFQVGLATGLLVGALGIIAPAPASAVINSTDAKNEACKGLSLSESDTSSCNPNTSRSASDLLARAINIISLIAGIIAVIMIIIGGIKYVTSQGESANISSAKDTILYAIIGLVIVALAQVIVRFVLYKTK